MLLVYGSLMSERVRTHVMGYSHAEYESAVITGYHRFAIKDRSYPALCKTSNCNEQVEGVLLKNVPDEPMRILDEFEGHEYVRTPVIVRTAGGEDIQAFVYEWVVGEKDPQLYGTWSFERDFLPQEEATLKLWGFIKD